MQTAIAMLMQDNPGGADGGNAYAQLARDYPNVVLVLGACFTACSAVVHAFQRWRTRRILDALDHDRLRDIGLTRGDLRNGRLDEVLLKQAATATPHGPWAAAWSWLLKIDRCRNALLGLREDQLCNLSEQGLKARREARHDCNGRCTGRASGARR
jgi:uncharacterized protein YjiS (DUF1127 family)